ncbi:MAG: SDR family NAD(P)-dependent oxidoreductase [Luminiphilus sp.]|nr:SDR family NAD(P)-dependent oxidoreductase [Luminiphilus sp.]MDG2441642.1 SDR family NAD(P)-dependent oxidoreductase [Luminiphilus sp.]
MTGKAVVVGVGGIGAAVANALIEQGYDEVHAVSRTTAPGLSSQVRHWSSDYSDASIESISGAISDRSGTLERLVITNGILQGEDYRPERALRQLSRATMTKIFEVNTMLPMLWLGAFHEALRQAEQPRMAVLSARVGSIGDNHLGGWYSYRASKAALNMMLQCASVEFGRLNKSAQILAFHPGTVDTPLSEPFQRGVPEGKLFTPEFVAGRLVELLENSPTTERLLYLDWDGKPIPF